MEIYNSLSQEEGKKLRIMNSTVLQNIDSDNQRDSLQIIIPVTVLYTLIFITGVIGNISTCIVIKKNRSMHTPTNYYLSSLAISDLLLLVSGVPHEIFYIWFKNIQVFGEFFCIGRGLIAETSANSTVMTITAFTVERYLAICYPLRSRSISKLNRASRVIVIIWLCSTILAIPQAARFGIRTTQLGIEKCTVVREIIQYSFQLSTIIFFFVPMLIIFILYMLIGLKLYRTKMSKSNSDNMSFCGSYSMKINGRKYDSMQNVSNYTSSSGNIRGGITQIGTRRVVRMLAAVVICFFICWAPFHAQRLIAVYGTSDVLEHHKIIYTIATYISGILYYLSTCINPIIYNLMSKKFRTAFKNVLFLKKPRTSNAMKYNNWNLNKNGQHSCRKQSNMQQNVKSFV